MNNDHFSVESFKDDAKMQNWMNERSHSGYKFVAMTSVYDEGLVVTTVIMEKEHQ